MDVKSSLALKKKRELLGSINKRKMSLRKHIDNLKQNECRLDITQITKCVFLGSLCLKPVPQLFDSPTLLEELDMKVGNVRSDNVILTDENFDQPAEFIINQRKSAKNDGVKKRNTKKKCLVSPKIKKKSLRERNESKNLYNNCNLSNVKNVARKVDMQVSLKPGKGKVSPTSKKKKENKNDLSIKPLKNKMTTDISSEVDTTLIIKPNKTEKQRESDNSAEFREGVIELQYIKTSLNDTDTEKQTESDNSSDFREDVMELQCLKTSFNDTQPINMVSSEVINAPIEELIVVGKPNESGNDITLDEANIIDFELFHANNSSENMIAKVEASNCILKDTIKTIESNLTDYEDERLKRDLTPELILSDSDDDTIDQLMFNIMDIKIGPNVFEKDFFDMPSSDIKEYEEYSEDFNETTDSPIAEEDVSKDKKLIKRTPQCKICSQVFSSYVKLKKHKEAHDGEKPYLCLKCGENHSTLDQLIAHLRTHQGKRPYMCKKCNKGFKSMKALENHQPVHVLRKVVPPKKTFKCEVCRKEFRKLCDLERHTRVHTGEKPSVCNICNRRFQQAHNLNKHLLIHTQEKPFQCDICNKRFGRNDVLNRHLLTHSVKKPNHCETCMKSFIRVSQLLAHKEKYHPQKNS